jgi:hypothetical protein
MPARQVRARRAGSLVTLIPWATRTAVRLSVAPHQVAIDDVPTCLTNEPVLRGMLVAPGLQQENPPWRWLCCRRSRERQIWTGRRQQPYVDQERQERRTTATIAGRSLAPLSPARLPPGMPAARPGAGPRRAGSDLAGKVVVDVLSGAAPTTGIATGKPQQHSGTTYPPLL